MVAIEVEVNLQPLDEVLDVGPRRVNTNVWQYRWWLIKEEFYEGNQPGLGGEIVPGWTGEETKVTTLMDISEYFPEGSNPFAWYTEATPGTYLDLDPTTDLKLARFYNLTERGPLPKLPFLAYRDSIDRQQAVEVS